MLELLAAFAITAIAVALIGAYDYLRGHKW